MNYQESGVNINTGDEFIKRISPLVNTTISKNVYSSLGGFGGFFDISNLPVKNPVLVSSTDGVGTKLKLAAKFDKLDTIGVDLVAMCVNDVIVSGAIPLFFLDYYATGKLDLSVGTNIISGIVNGCIQSDVSLIGGETAEMPLLYNNEDFDLAGFCVGVVDKEKIINPTMVNQGDIIIGIESSGPHSNGYSLINRIFNFDTISEDLVEKLLTPTKIYAKAIKYLIQEIDVHGFAHITGGGITENLPRILPEHLSAFIDLKMWHRPMIFDVIRNISNIDKDEMLKVFNCGIGMIVIVSKDDVNDTIINLRASGEVAHVIGHISPKLLGHRVLYAY